MLKFIAHLKRFNKVAGTLGPTWTCTNSMLSEPVGNNGAVDGLGKSPGGRSAYSPLQQHCGRLETLCDRRQEKKR